VLAIAKEAPGQVIHFHMENFVSMNIVHAVMLLSCAIFAAEEAYHIVLHVGRDMSTFIYVEVSSNQQI